MIDPASLAFASIDEIGARLRAREVTSSALVEALLARIDSIGPKLVSFATVTRDLARAEARAADEEIAAGKWRGPLHGIPYAAKDLLDTAGIPTTFGSRAYEGRVPPRDATVIARLRDAGAVLLGKASMTELAGAFGGSPRFGVGGPFRNPWDVSKWSGGSSAGSASSVAAGLCPFAIGSETLGSLMTPGAFCGVTALRPTYGVVSRAGAMALSYTMDKIGVLARSAIDAAIVLRAIAGQDPHDPSSVEPPPDLDQVRAGSWTESPRVAVLTPEGVGDAAYGPLYAAAIAQIEALGARITRTRLPDLPYSEVAVAVLRSEAAAAFEELARDGRYGKLVDPAAFEKETSGPDVPRGGDYVKAMRVRAAIQAALETFFASYDVVIAPGLTIGAISADDADMRSFRRGMSSPATAAGNVAGLPAVTLPIGFVGSPKLPAAMQILAPPLGEAAALRLAAAYQARTRWHVERPPLG